MTSRGKKIFLALSIILSLVEINKSTKAIELVLGDIEELSKENIAQWASFNS